MMSERRFSDEEVAQIFERATSGHALQTTRAAEGMTLAELQSIGAEVGIPAEQITRAALSLSPAEAKSTQRFLGMTTGVGHTVHLARKLTDEEWERFIVDVRETFNAGVAHDIGLVASFGVLGVIGIGTAVTTALRLQGWVGTRKAQMEELGVRVSAMALKPPPTSE